MQGSWQSCPPGRVGAIFFFLLLNFQTQASGIKSVVVSVTVKPDMENVNLFTQADCFNPKLYPEARKLCQNLNFNKTGNNANTTIFMSITTLIPLGYQEVNLFDLLHSFSQ